MQVLVATTETQGSRDTDFSWTVDGELVRLPGIECCDPRCGCGRSWAGIASSKATTTCRVAEVDIDRDALRAAFTGALEREGWLPPGEDRTWVDEFVDSHLDIAESFPVGTVLENGGDRVLVRPAPGPDGAG